MSTITETKHAGEFLVREFDPSFNREQITVNSGQDLGACTVLGRLLSIGAATFVGTVGTRGAVTVAATVGAKIQIGTYKLICVAASSNAGTFQLRAPDGSQVPFDTASTITVGGGAYTSDHLGITIADGATDFSVGDTYTIAVSGGDYEILDPAEDDGAQLAAGILYGAVDATSADAVGVALVRGPAIIASAALAWPDGISDANKAAALARLNSLGIVAR